MKQYLILPTIIISALLAVTALAGVVTIPNEFQAGERARAAEVNDNFTAVKTAVDDNHARITELEDQVKETGAVSVPAVAFISLGTSCTFRRDGHEYVYIGAAGQICDIGAPLALPHEATITEVSCLVQDTETTPSVSLMVLRRINQQTGAGNAMYAKLDVTTDSATPVVFNLPNVSGVNVVDNTTYSYSIGLVLDATSIATFTNLRLYNCKVAYTLDDVD